ncbi:2,3-diphosphoglycerate-dependent phosphoglycerate mutase [Buchnera aphidicola (Ceratoglyphina bambusae)]|uniref:2,3-diphosphoglycerate-dependent phosphoglycerate mutase n=1 Tax=Buchnera aphidicola TaxID=9 RepID=UPI0031B85D96
MKKIELILIRHGQSVWNKLNKFTGWEDVNLSKKGKKEAKKAAKLLLNKNFTFDLVFTSLLKRAIYTTWIILKKLNRLWIPVYKSWRLNERHYGLLQGLNKQDTILKYGKDRVQEWRRSYKIAPPKINIKDKSFPGNDPKYFHVEKNLLPTSESLKCTINRVLPYWNKFILPELKKRKKIIIVAHGNSLRALIKYLHHIDEKDILKLDIPTGRPIIYEFDKNIQPVKFFYL